MATTNLDSISLSTGLATASLADGAVTTAKLAAALQAMPRSHAMPTIPTTGAVEVLFRAPYTGTVTAASFVGKDALTQAAAFVTFSITNKGAAGSGSTAVLAATDPNTTKTSTGSPIGAYTPFPLTLNATPANLAVTKGDVLAFTATVSGGTLANTITEGLAVIEFQPA